MRITKSEQPLSNNNLHFTNSLTQLLSSWLISDLLEAPIPCSITFSCLFTFPFCSSLESFVSNIKHSLVLISMSHIPLSYHILVTFQPRIYLIVPIILVQICAAKLSRRLTDATKAFWSPLKRLPHTCRVCFPNQLFQFFCNQPRPAPFSSSTSHSVQYFTSYFTMKAASHESSLYFHSPNLHICESLFPSFPVLLLQHDTAQI